METRKDPNDCVKVIHRIEPYNFFKLFIIKLPPIENAMMPRAISVTIESSSLTTFSWKKPVMEGLRIIPVTIYPLTLGNLK